jgi:site-specific DNA-methyltransferase (adenine-specific)
MTPYYDDGQVAIYHADVRDFTAEELGQAACVTSPPYNVGVAYDSWDDSLPDGSYHLLAVGVSKLIGDVLARLAGRAWVNVGVARPHTWLDALRAAGLAERHVVCWDYGIATADTAWGSWQSPSAPHLRHGREAIIVASAADWARDLPAGIGSQWRDWLGNWAPLCRDIWRIPPGASTNSAHPAVMPARAIRLSTWPGEIVVDPFCGSGTTLLAARGLGRRAIGVEISERYCELAARRLAQGVLEVVG